MKDESKIALESALHSVIVKKVEVMQAVGRGMLGRLTAKKRKNARDTIARNVCFFIIKQRWKKSVLSFASKFKEVVVKLQRAFRFKRRRELIMSYFRIRKRACLTVQGFYKLRYRFNERIRLVNERTRLRKWV